MSLDKRFAVLIDADNVSDKYIQFILDELIQRRNGDNQTHLWGLD